MLAPVGSVLPVSAARKGGIGGESQKSPKGQERANSGGVRKGRFFPLPWDFQGRKKAGLSPCLIHPVCLAKSYNQAVLLREYSLLLA